MNLPRRAQTVAQADPVMITQTLTLLHPPGDVVEIRILNTGKTGTVSGYFDDLDKAPGCPHHERGRL